MIRVLVVDDEELVRTGLRMILEGEDDLEVVGEATDGAEAVSEVRRTSPDVVLMDVQMPRVDGIEATRLLTQRDGPRVLILTTFHRSELVYDALVAGASGFLLKDMPRPQLVAGIRAVTRGEEPIAPAITRQVIAEFTRPGPPELPAGYHRLTDREREVFALVARGCSNAEIADELVVSLQTVKSHVARMLDKLGLRDRVHAVISAYESGLVRRGSAGR
jgi:DNA-binding NarL/FixJ family response regulator